MKNKGHDTAGHDGGLEARPPLYWIRYGMEHLYLPEMFYRDRQRFVARFLEDDRLLSDIFRIFFSEQEGAGDNPYRPEQFRQELIQVDAETYCLGFHFPPPEYEPLCDRAWLFFDMRFERAAYFCVERGNRVGDGAAAPDAPDPFFLCAWTEDHTHLNYGKQDVSDGRDLEICYALYRKGLPEPGQL